MRVRSALLSWMFEVLIVIGIIGTLLIVVSIRYKIDRYLHPDTKSQVEQVLSTLP